MPNFSIPLSGLNASNTALANISNNLANLNTTGYKDTTVNFQNMFYNLLGSNGSGDQLQVGSGVSVASTSTNFVAGSTSSTGVDTDVAITGNGFFVVQNGSNTAYTRAGDFTRDNSGNLVTASGENVMGYSATNGVVNQSGGLVPIQLQDGMVNPPKASTAITMPANLSSDDTAASFSTTMNLADSATPPVSHVMTVTYTRSTNGWNYTATIPTSDITVGGTGNTSVATGALASDAFGTLTAPGTINPTFPTLLSGGTISAASAAITPASAQTSLTAAATASTSSYNTNVTVYDSLGSPHVLNVAYTRTATGWNYNATLPSSEITGATGTSTSVAKGALTFDNNGVLTSTAPISVNVSNLADGASPLAITWNLKDSSGTGLLTQVAGQSSSGTTSDDGYTSGTMTDFTINSDGTILGVFTNGSKVLGQVALADFANLQGLSKDGDNNYSATIASGSAVVGSPGSGSLGSLTGKSLELSNVDMSTEFSNLIVAERGFQANAKSVTTFDQIAQDTIGMIR